jgi:hypothetical protein
MATDKEIRLVAQLLDKTKKRLITWEPTVKEDEFVSTLGGTVSFTVGSWQETAILTMRDQLDRVVVTIDSDPIPQVLELLAEARRQALNVEESLDNVLDQLARMG